MFAGGSAPATSSALAFLTGDDPDKGGYSSLLMLLENSTLPGSPSSLLLLANHSQHPATHAVGGRGGGGDEGGLGGGGVGEGEGLGRRRWGVLGLMVIIVCSIVGNLLVCLAVCWERRLQNMTNYFLMSLAIADLLVSIVVMPLGMIVELFGYFPLESEVCVVWVSSDVLMCTASIWHMCTMSMDRYFTLKYPMRYGRNKTKTMVILKIFFVWVVSVAISSPICIHGFVNPSIVFNDGVCVPVLKDFVIYGSVFAFYIPLLIMIVTYVLTIHILWKNQQLMQKMNQTELRPGLAQLTAQCTGFAMPQMPRLISPVVSPEDGNSDTDAAVVGASANHLSNGRCHLSVSVSVCGAALASEQLSNGDVAHHLGSGRRAGSPPRVSGPPPVRVASPCLLPSAHTSPSSPLLSPPHTAPSQSLSCPQYLHMQQVGSSKYRHRSAGDSRDVTDSEGEDEERESDLEQASTRLLQEKSLSYRSLCARNAMTSTAEDFFNRACSSSSTSHLSAFATTPGSCDGLLSPSGISGSFREPGRKSGQQKPTHLHVPSQVFFSRRGRVSAMTSSDTQLTASGSCSSSSRPAFHQSFAGLEKDYKSAEWDRRFFQIQKEMDDCLLDGRAEGGGEGSGASARMLTPDDDDDDDGGTVFISGLGKGAAVLNTVDRREVVKKRGNSDTRDPKTRPCGVSPTCATSRGQSPPASQPRKKKFCPSLSASLLVARQLQKNSSSSNNNNAKARGSKALSQSAPNTPDRRRRHRKQPENTSDSDLDGDTSGSSNSDVITIRLHPPSSPKHADININNNNNNNNSGQQSASEDMTENSNIRSVVVSSEADNTMDDSDVLNTNDESPADSRERPLRRSGKHKRLLKARFRNTLRASSRPMLKTLMSKKTASNERKASKVLGIIFLVFVILWTPFFIVNILSVTCSTCMRGLTMEMMTVFVWMGYVASLANPIIYTMFNTAFRRTFIKILTCRINRQALRRMKFSDLPTFPSLTTTMMASDQRRGTMTVFLEHRN